MKVTDVIEAFSNKAIEEKVSKEAMEITEHIISEMGADLHDDLIQKLSVLRLHMDKIERSSFDSRQTKEALALMQSDFQSIIDSVRRISRRLLPIRMEEDTFNKRIEMLCQNMDTLGSMRINPYFEGSEKPVSETSELYLLRMVQELIQNAFRHSSAWSIWVRVYWGETTLRIEVEDDGSGITKIDEFVELLRKKRNTIRMRAVVIGAKINYQRGAKGLRATIEIPLG